MTLLLYSADVSLNHDVQNLAGVNDDEMDKLIGLRAAIAVAGAHDKPVVDSLMRQFVPWLQNSGNASDKVKRRYTLLTICEAQPQGMPTDPTKLRKLVESLYSLA
ncbi:hypothetical protein [Saccharopolyspora tripterygii]